MTPHLVVKVGGSLLDQPGIAARLRTFLAKYDAPVLLIPGGGRLADAIRVADAADPYPGDAAHWLAVGAMALQAHALAARLGGRVVSTWDDVQPFDVLNPMPFLRGDVGAPLALPAGWHVTSDSIAARVAEAARLPLLLLKSAPPAPPHDLEAWAAAGYVDANLPAVVRRANLSVGVALP